jgi:membrane protein CcdC involved in cytochrome C biogenesis
MCVYFDCNEGFNIKEANFDLHKVKSEWIIRAIKFEVKNKRSYKKRAQEII